MDPAVARVQAYLQLNAYLTVAEFPIVAAGVDGVETITDVDLIAVRFPLAQPLGAGPAHAAQPVPALRVSGDAMDLLICEVKEGKARVNPNLSRADTLRGTLERIGCCARLAVFAGRPGDARRAPVVISLAHAAREICRFLRDHREALHAMRLTQPVLAHLHLLEKVGALGRGQPATAMAKDA